MSRRGIILVIVVILSAFIANMAGGTSSPFPSHRFQSYDQYMDEESTERILDDYYALTSHAHSVTDVCNLDTVKTYIQDRIEGTNTSGLNIDYRGPKGAKGVYDASVGLVANTYTYGTSTYSTDNCVNPFVPTSTSSYDPGGTATAGGNLTLEIEENGSNVEYNMHMITTQIDPTVVTEDTVYTLIIAHMDSAPSTDTMSDSGQTIGSRGATDSYGVVVALELMRQISEYKAAGGEMVNGVKFLFTDAKHYDSAGMSQLLQAGMGTERTEERYFLEDINIAIELDARGMSGAVTLVNTTENDRDVVKLYSHAESKVAYSTVSNAYGIEHSSDLDEIKNTDPKLIGRNVKISGMTLAPVGNTEQWGTTEDTLESLDLGTVKHFLKTVVPITTEYVSSSQYSSLDYFESNRDMTYFTALPFLTIMYSQIFVIAFIVLILGLVLFVQFIEKDHLELSLLTMDKLFIYAFLLGSFLITLILSIIIGFIFGVGFSFTDMIGVPGKSVIFWILAIAFSVVAFVFYDKQELDNDNMLESAMVVNVLILLFTFFVFRSATFLWTIPGFILPTILILRNRLDGGSTLSRDIITLVYVGLMVIFGIPSIMALLQAMTFGGISIAIVLFMSIMVTILPLIKAYHEDIPFFETWSFK